MAFHIQTFFMIAGYLAFPKAGSLQVQIGRQASLYYAYLLWSVISWTISSVMANAVNHPVSFHELLFIPIVPIQHFWFLLPLMLGTALMGILRAPLLLLTGCLVFVVLMSVPGLAQLGIYGWVFYVLFGGLLRAANLRPKANLLPGIAGAVVLFGGAWNEVHGEQWLSWPPLSYIVTLSGCYAAYVGRQLRDACQSGRVGAWPCSAGTPCPYSCCTPSPAQACGSYCPIRRPAWISISPSCCTILSGVYTPIAIRMGGRANEAGDAAWLQVLPLWAATRLTDSARGV